jgi:hypothetical protein
MKPVPHLADRNDMPPEWPWPLADWSTPVIGNELSGGLARCPDFNSDHGEDEE